MQELTNALTNAQLIYELAAIESDDCTIWPKGTDGCGYAKVWTNGRYVGGHRIALGVRLGRDLLRTEHALHTCDTPPCVNPRHLRVGDAKANNTDMYAKGRGNNLRGSAHGRAKFDEATVRRIKAMHRSGTGVAEIARIVSAPYTRVMHVCTGQNWRHIE